MPSPPSLRQTVQRGRRVRDPAVLPHLAAQAARRPELSSSTFRDTVTARTISSKGLPPRLRPWFTSRWTSDEDQRLSGGVERLLAPGFQCGGARDTNREQSLDSFF